MLMCSIYSTLFDGQTLNATCNSHCDCKSTVFEPVCSDGITYFSPCRAGCDKYYLNGDKDVSELAAYSSIKTRLKSINQNCNFKN